MMSYYGNYRTRTFSEIFPEYNDFNTFYTTCGVPQNLLTGAAYTNFGLPTIYYLLISNFSNSHIKQSDEGRFKLKLMSIIFEAGPQWQRAMKLQADLVAMSDADLLKGSKAIYNHAMHPDTEPSTGQLEELEYIDDQNVTNYRKDKVIALVNAMDALDSNICDRFINRFRKLFINVLYPDYPLLYTSEEDYLDEP